MSMTLPISQKGFGKQMSTEKEMVLKRRRVEVRLLPCRRSSIYSHPEQRSRLSPPPCTPPCNIDRVNISAITREKGGTIVHGAQEGELAGCVFAYTRGAAQFRRGAGAPASRFVSASKKKQ